MCSEAVSAPPVTRKVKQNRRSWKCLQNGRKGHLIFSGKEAWEPVGNSQLACASKNPSGVLVSKQKWEPAVDVRAGVLSHCPRSPVHVTMASHMWFGHCSLIGGTSNTLPPLLTNLFLLFSIVPCYMQLLHSTSAWFKSHVFLALFPLLERAALRIRSLISW